MNAIAKLITAAINGWCTGRRPLTVGVCGPQGSGKSTATAQVAAALTQRGLRVAILSLDDLYLDRAGRARLAAQVHPLFATRGPPGTHDVAMGIAVLDALQRGDSVSMPRFDKGRDEPAPRSGWPRFSEPVDIILFEGWCVGAAAQDTTDLVEPINALERNEDSEGLWRRAVNAALAGPYQPLWKRIDRLVLLTAPDFCVVQKWRREQEQALINSGAPAAMNDTAIARFVQHYERLTRHITKEMPGRADLVIALDEVRGVTSS